jgi:hypothetical protein
MKTKAARCIGWRTGALENCVGNAEVPSEEFSVERGADAKAGLRGGPNTRMKVGVGS